MFPKLAFKLGPLYNLILQIQIAVVLKHSFISEGSEETSFYNYLTKEINPIFL